ncbi:hypothetical protein, partial [Treponema sp. R6D11]
MSVEYGDGAAGNNWQSSDGSWHSTRGAAEAHEQGAAGGGGKGGGGGIMGGMSGIFVALFILGPIIIAKLVGLIWGLLLKLGFVGKIITTALMIIAGPFILLMAFGFSGHLFNNANAEIQKYLFIIAPVILAPTWYFLWHYDVVKEMGALVFSDIVKKFAMFIWFGAIASMIIGIFKNQIAEAVFALGTTAAGFVYYIIATRPYAHVVAERNKGVARKVLKSTVMLIAVGFTVALCVADVILIKVEYNKNIAVSAEIMKPITDAAKKAATQNVFVTVVSDYSADKGTPIYSNTTESWDAVVKWAKKGSKLRVTGEVIKNNEDYFVPVEYEGVRGFIKGLFYHDPYIELATGGQTVQSTIPEISIPEETT